MLEEMASRIEQSPRRTFVDPEATWCARAQRERPIIRIALPGGARLVAVSVAALVLLAPWLA
jgi:hypothetical protein